MKRTRTKALAAATLATVFVAASATTSFADNDDKPADAPGHYIVVLKSDPLATYKGGVKGLKATKPAKGQQLDSTSDAAKQYKKHLANTQADLLARIGVTPDYSYQTALSGFSATLTADQLAQLQASDEVEAVYPDEIIHTATQSLEPTTDPTADPTTQPTMKPSPAPTTKPSPAPTTEPSPAPTTEPSPAPTTEPSPAPTPPVIQPVPNTSTDFLGLGDDETGAGGLWDELGGVDQAGDGIVVGVIDYGIAPENPSFAGKPLKTKNPAKPGKRFNGKQPYTDGTTVYYDKSDGGQFHATMVEADGWDKSAYSTKLVGAQFFAAGAKAAGVEFSANGSGSPRDDKDHGTHVASTAAGNFHVPATIDGRDYGTISGVAPAAKIATYKPCFNTGKFDGCVSSDEVAAIDQAVADGVDVINMSLGAPGGATTVLNAEDRALLNAAEAGIFVAMSAGNSGPDSSTVGKGSPWYTAVAASTTPAWQGTVQFDGFAAAGGSLTLTPGETLTGPSIYAADAALTAPAAATFCVKGTLDPAKVAGHIVVCDRDEVPLPEKAQTVKDAGGIGMVVLNLPSSPATVVPGEMYVVPTVHLTVESHDRVVEYVRAGTDRPITLVGGNATASPLTVPQIASFSSRGPVLASGSDVMKPDITAPGVDILAAIKNAAGSAPAFGFESGTSMASPHIAGLAALYLGQNPTASPAEIKSAMMTTAYDTVNADGSAATDPFAQGAGQVDPSRYLHPGLLYLNGADDWKAFLAGKGLMKSPGVDPIDGSDLNLPSFAIGNLAGAQTVTRTVTSTAAGTYTASAAVPGVDVSIEPAVLSFDAPGQSKTYTVTFTRNTAPLDSWATGFVTWSSDKTTVRSPVAVFPTAADASAEVSGTGIEGSTSAEFTAGIDGEVPLTLAGLAPYTLLTDPTHSVAGHSGDENSGANDKHLVTFIATIPEGTKAARFDLDSSDDTGSNLDLTTARLNPDGTVAGQTQRSASSAADEQVTLTAPEPGTYAVVVTVTSTSGPMTWDLSQANMTAEGEGSLAANPSTIVGVAGQHTSYDLSWSGLKAGTRYVGAVSYGDTTSHTYVTVDAK